MFLTEAIMNPVTNKVGMMEVMFEKLQVNRIQYGMQALMSLFAEGMETAMLLDSGDGVTHVIPVFDGNGTRLGEVVGFQDFGAGDLMEVEMSSGTIGLVPFADSMVPFVDVDEGRIVLSDTGVAVLHADVELSEKKVGIQ